MKGFIKITLLSGDVLLINVSKIRVVKPSVDGSVISLDDPSVLKALGGSFNPAFSVNNINLGVKYDSRSITAKEGFEEVCALIEAAQS